MMKELDQIALTTDLPGLQAGDIGTVVLVHQGGAGYEVEFVTLDGETLAVVSLFAANVRPIRHREIARARPRTATARRLIRIDLGKEPDQVINSGIKYRMRRDSEEG